MTFIISEPRKVKGRTANSLNLRFTLTKRWGELDDPFTETIRGCLAGISEERGPWLMPPSNRNYHLVEWSNTVRDHILKALVANKLLEGLSSAKSVFVDEDTRPIVWEVK